MKLSDAIATGRVLLPESEWNSATYWGCALAIGLVGAGQQPEAKSSLAWREAAVATWPWLEDRYADPCPLYDDRCDSAINIISGMFIDVRDSRSMTLDQLVDWIAANEPSEPQPEAAFEKAEADYLERPVGEQR